jgi:hypothetical protein
VDEVAVATPLAFSFTVLAALGFPKITDRTILDSNLVVVIKLAILVSEASLGLLLSRKLNVNIAYHVFTDVVHNHDVKDLPILAKLDEDLLEEFFEMVSCF